MTKSLIVVCPHCHAPNRLPEEKIAQEGRCGKCKQPLHTGEPVELDSASFDRHASRSELPVVVDFWAPWCGPCRAMAPAFAHASKALGPSVQLAKLNTEAEPAIASRFAIRSIPTLIIFQGGREIARQSGAMDLNTLTRWIGSHT